MVIKLKVTEDFHLGGNKHLKGAVIIIDDHLGEDLIRLNKAVKYVRVEKLKTITPGKDKPFKILVKPIKGKKSKK